MTISQRANDIRDPQRQAKVGDRVSADYLDKLLTLINVNPQAAAVRTVTVTGATNDKTYTITIDGIDVSYTSDATATLAEIADGLAAAINADPLVRGRVSAVSDSVDTVTITALLPGQDFTLTESDAQLTTASVTAAATADAIPFGRLLISDGYVADEPNLQCKLPKAANFTAQVDTLTLAYVALAEYHVSVTLDGVEYKAQATANTDAPTTAANLATALNGVLPANTVLASNSGGDLILTAEVPGDTFSTGYGASNDGASIPVMSLSSNRGVATSLIDSAVGISLYSSDEEVTSIGGTAVEYPANAGVKALARGGVWVESSQSPSLGDPVYVETAAGADTGKLFNTKTATRVLLPAATWQRAARSDTTDTIAALKLDL